MAYTLSRIDRVYRDYDVTATDKDGAPAVLTGVTVALLTPRTSPTAATVWTAADYDAGTATVLLAGPDADDTDALVVPSGGADLWIKAADSPEIDAERVERISVQ